MGGSKLTQGYSSLHNAEVNCGIPFLKMLGMLKTYMASKFDYTHSWKKNSPRALKPKNAVSSAGSLCAADH